MITDKNNSWLRIRYGRLSVDSDDQNCNKKCDVDDDEDDTLVEYKVATKCCDKINVNASSQLYDANGNKVNVEIPIVDDIECDCLSVQVDSRIKNTISKQNDALRNKEGTMDKLMSFSLSDYGMFDDLSFFCYLI